MMLKKTFVYAFLFITISLHFNTGTMAQTVPANKVLMVGDLKVNKLVDGQLYLKLALLSGIEPAEAKKLNNNVDSAGTPVNAYLVQTPHHLVLVDAGMGAVPGMIAGHLLEQIKADGVDPAKIDLILITHFHFDHIGGLTSKDGKRLFPNATVRASQTESDFWLKDSTLIPQNLKERAAQIKGALAPYLLAKAYQPFAENADLGDGIQALSANGHTPGHTVYSFTSKGQTIWCIGDLIHFGTIQFNHPLAGVVFDSNSPMAIASRLDFFKRAAASHIILAAAHLPEIIRVEKKQDSFVALPVTTK